MMFVMMKKKLLKSIAFYFLLLIRRFGIDILKKKKHGACLGYISNFFVNENYVINMPINYNYIFLGNPPNLLNGNKMLNFNFDWTN